MKKILVLFALFSFVAISINAQTPIIYQPGPGLNDGTDEGGINGGKDAFVGDWDNLNHGIDVAWTASPISNCNNTTWFSYMKFDVNSLPSNVDSVILVFHHLNPSAYCYSNCNADFHFARVLDVWSEIALNFTTLPAKDTDFYSRLSLNWDDTLGIGRYDITSTYNLWRNEVVPNNGFAIYSSTVGCNNACVYFSGWASDDTAIWRRPYLEVYEATSGIINENINSEIKIFPNPVSDSQTISFTNNKSESAEIQLLNINGSVLFSEYKKLSDGINQLNFTTQHLQSGIYILRIQTNEKIVLDKVIKI